MKTLNVILIIVFSTYLHMAGCSELPSGFADEENIELQGLTQSDPPLAAIQSTARMEQGPWIPFEVLQTTIPPVPPFDRKFSGNTIHDRGVQPSGLLAGDIEGTFTSTLNAPYHLKDGVFSGPVRLTGTWNVSELFGEPANGTFEIRGHGRNQLGGPFSGNLIGHGTGDMEGMKPRSTFERRDEPGTFVIKGSLLDP